MMMLDLSAELQYSFSRSGGKGGQNVNKVETKVLLRFDLAASQLLVDWQKEIIREKLGGYISQEDVLQLTCEETRSQLKNKEIVSERFHQLVKTALTPVKVRKKRSVPRSVKEKRLKDKRHKSEKKQNRRKDWF
ncbi:MAG: alternative ribosome rescue aminoacyl-tRNA hydrolase ArfB [Bacteroidota bacterium]